MENKKYGCSFHIDRIYPKTKLNQLFSAILYFNNFAKPVLISDDKNYYYVNISGGWITEILKENLNNMDDFGIIQEAQYILSIYK